MPSQGLVSDPLDRLDIGASSPRGRHQARWRAVGLVVLGGVLGWGAHVVTVGERPDEPHPLPVELVAGSFEQNVRDPFGPGFLVSLTNIGHSGVRVLGIAPLGWGATSAPVQVAAGEAVDVPVNVSLSCGSDPPPSDVVVVRVATRGGSRSVALRLPEIPAALQEMYVRRCAVATLSVPSRRDLLGTWMVADGGPAFTGRMLIRLGSGGRYRMTAGDHLDGGPGAVGRFALRGDRLVLRESRGGDCGPRRRAVWDVGLRPDGLLRIEQLTAYDGFCTVQRGDVWVASRLPG